MRSRLLFGGGIVAPCAWGLVVAFFGAGSLPDQLLAAAVLLGCLAAEGVSRHLFFRSEAMPTMPGR